MSEIPKEEIVGSLNARASMTLVVAAVKKIILRDYITEPFVSVSLEELKHGEDYLLVVRVKKDGSVLVGVQTRSEDAKESMIRLIIEGCEGSGDRL